MDGSSQGLLTSASFQLGISAATGALERITHPADAHAMNWVCNPADTPWHPIGNGWGLGHVALPWRGVAIHRWQVPTACSLRDDRAEIGYDLPMLQITATRRMTTRDTVEEHYAFRNTTGAPLDIGRISIATPWNDNYPDAETCLTRRCNAHVWCGGTTTYTYGLRMGNTAPHLGLVVTEGDFTGYSIEDRGLLLGSSNLRGTILLNHRGVVLAPGATLSIRWRLFWHHGAEDFFTQALTVPGFMRLDADRYTLALGESATIRLQAPTLDAPVTLAFPGEAGAPARLAPPESCVAVQPRVLGDCVVRAEAPDGRHTWLRLWTAPPLGDLVRALLPLLEAFNGRQPDHHLNAIAIRHWDGFWFGRRRLWGDTFPHYWSSVSGYVFHLAAAALDDSAYAAQAKLALMNNLSLFTPDGRGSCAHIYPESVNGEPGRLNDELANDQDWALVYLLKAIATGLNGESKT